MDTLERRVWGERRPKDPVTLQIILVFTLTHDLHTIYIQIYLYMVNVIYIYTLQQISVSVKNLDVQE
jgi:hypothetical protein